MAKCECKYFNMIEGELYCSECGKPARKSVEKPEDKSVKKAENK